MPQILISIGLVIVAIGVVLLPSKQQPSETLPRVVVNQRDITDGKKIMSRQWNVVLPDQPRRFYEMMGNVNGQNKILGAWDTVRGEALLYPEYASFFTNPKK